jgi:hypothetical protein
MDGIYFHIALTHPLNSTVVKQAARKPLAAAKHMETIQNNKVQVSHTLSSKALVDMDQN